MAAPTEPVPEFPPLSPAGETVVHDATSFAASCLSKLEAFPSRKNWKLGAPIVTRVDKWGLLWRVDFKIVGEEISPSVNRIVCWGTKDGTPVNIQIAIGQDVAPLSPP